MYLRKNKKLSLLNEIMTCDSQEKATDLTKSTSWIDPNDNFTFRIEISPRLIMFSDFCLIADSSSYYTYYFGRILTEDAIKIVNALESFTSQLNT